MTKEEQVGFFGAVASIAAGLKTALTTLGTLVSQTSLKQAVPVADLERFREIVESLTGYPDALFVLSSPMDRLRPPLQELEQYEARIRGLVGGWTCGAIGMLQPPLHELEEFERRLGRLTGLGSLGAGSVAALRPPLDELRLYEEQLDRVLEKVRRLARLPHKLE